MIEFEFEELLADMLDISDEQRKDGEYVSEQLYERFSIDFDEAYAFAEALLQHTPIVDISGKRYHAFVSKDITINCIKFKKKFKKWEDLKNIEGWEVDSETGKVIPTASFLTHPSESCKTIWATKEQAEACLAMSQLSQLMAHVNGDWTPDWHLCDVKHVIQYSGTELRATTTYTQCFLAFKDEKTRNEFLDTHIELIEQAKPLL